MQLGGREIETLAGSRCGVEMAGTHEASRFNNLRMRYIVSAEVPDSIYDTHSEFYNIK